MLAGQLEAAPPVEQLTELLVGALRFEAYPEVLPVLGALRARGVRVAVVSDWDCTLAEHLARLGLGEWVDAVVVSAVVGVAKPDPRMFTAALTRARRRARVPRSCAAMIPPGTWRGPGPRGSAPCSSIAMAAIPTSRRAWARSPRSRSGSSAPAWRTAGRSRRRPRTAGRSRPRRPRRRCASGR